MGGKAFKSINTHRLAREDYERIKNESISIIKSVLGAKPRLVAIDAYRAKPDFGDLDLLVEDLGVSPQSIQTIAECFHSREHVINGNVVSYDYKGFQVDTIFTPPEQFKASQWYFAWNDLGNLIGRIADSAGLKYGWDGLIYRVMDGSEKLEDIVVTRDPAVAIHFLGYDADRFTKGFDTVEDIFRYTTSSPHFHPDLYLLENRNAKSRVRDAKRKTYTGFLQWLKASDGLKAYHQEVSSSHGGWQREDKAVWLARLRATFPEFREALDRVRAEKAKLELFKTYFNGETVSSMTGLKNQALGQFMAEFRDCIVMKSGTSFRTWSIGQTEESVGRALKDHLSQRSLSTGKPSL